MKKSAAVFIALFAAVICAITSYAADISVYVNGEQLETDTAPIIVDDRTLVPMRAVFEALGASVEWDERTQTVMAYKDGQMIGMTVGHNNMTVGGESVALDVAPIISNDRVLVPLRAVSEALSAGVTWEEASRSIFISTGGANMPFVFSGGRSVNIGMSESELLAAMGEPTRRETSIGGLDWCMFAEDAANYVMVAIGDDNTVCGLYVAGADFVYNDFDSAAYTTEEFADTYDNDNVYAVLILPAGNQKSVDITAEGALETIEADIFDVTNAYRAAHGLSILAYDETAQKAAKVHNDDMVANNFLSHVGTDGTQPWDRYMDLGGGGTGWGENIAGGYYDAAHAFAALIDSEGHRENVLRESFTHMGVSAVYGAYSKYKCYITLFFVTL